MSFALIDPEFAKSQLILLGREWMMHPNGQIPAYEWAFDDVNPPVHAWAAWRVYTIERRIAGKGDTEFLAKVFHKLLLNFTWWVNRKDVFGDNVFEGGFLGLDNIGIFDRNKILEDGMTLEQSDGTSWMAFFCLQMLTIALELSRHDHAYEDVASKFFEHFLYIAKAMNDMGKEGASLWDNEDGFFYDTLHRRDGTRQYVKVRSAVGIIPLFAVMVAERNMLEEFPACLMRMDWFLEHKPELVGYVASMVQGGQNDRRLFSIVNRDPSCSGLSWSGCWIRASSFPISESERFPGPTRTTLTRFKWGTSRQASATSPANPRPATLSSNSNWRVQFGCPSTIC